MGKATGTSKCCLKYTKIVPINARALAVTKVRFEGGNKWRFCLERPLQSCGARTGSGTMCQKPPLSGEVRCRLHGSLCTSPVTAEGKARIAAAHWKHGQRSRGLTETHSSMGGLRAVEARMDADGLI